MKNLWSLICLMALTTTLAIASPAPTVLDDNPTDWNMMTTKIGEKTIQLQLNNLNEMNTRIEITSLDGDIQYFSHYVKKHNGFNKALDLSQMPAGRYLLKVYNKNGAQSQIILIRESQLLMSQSF